MNLRAHNLSAIRVWGRYGHLSQLFGELIELPFFAASYVSLFSSLSGAFCPLYMHVQERYNAV